MCVMKYFMSFSIGFVSLEKVTWYYEKNIQHVGFTLLLKLMQYFVCVSSSTNVDKVCYTTQQIKNWNGNVENHI